MVEQHKADQQFGMAPANERSGGVQWLVAEAKYHLFPWGPGFLRQKPSMVAATIGLAIAVTIVWLLAAAGTMAPAAVIAWWTGWSVYECLCRMRCKPWIKEGPWWGSNYRRATMVDMIAYVATKNLLIGAALFLMLYLLGALPASGA